MLGRGAAGQRRQCPEVGRGSIQGSQGRKTPCNRCIWAFPEDQSKRQGRAGLQPAPPGGLLETEVRARQLHTGEGWGRLRGLASSPAPPD